MDAEEEEDGWKVPGAPVDFHGDVKDNFRVNVCDAIALSGRGPGQRTCCVIFGFHRQKRETAVANNQLHWLGLQRAQKLNHYSWMRDHRAPPDPLFRLLAAMPRNTSFAWP
jgi:hypothetical protein